MDGLILLQCARDAGLRIEAAGDKLLIRGPKNAEAVVKLLAQHKANVLAALAPGAMASRRWRERFTARTLEWFSGDRDWNTATRLAWGDLENELHQLYGPRWPASQCAGCHAQFGSVQALNLPDGNRVHLDPISCLVNFGRRWRLAATTALVALGLDPPNTAETRHDRS